MGISKQKLLAGMAGVLWVCAAAYAGGDQLECGADSVLPVPPDYAERCGTGLPPTELQALVPEVVPGDLAFYKANFPGPLELRTAPLPSLSFTTVGAQTRPLYAMAFDPFATNLYAVDDITRELGRLDQTTGVFTSIGLLNPDPAGATVTGLTFDAATGIAYFTATNGAIANLYTIDLSNAALTLIGPITGFPFVIDIAIDRFGQMYGHDINVDQLVSIDKSSGAATALGPTGLAANFAQGMMYDASDDTLYGCAFVTSPAQQGHLVSFDRTTGAATILATVPDEMECSVKVVPILALSKTVGTVADVCAATNTMTVPLGTPVTYCYLVINTGGVTLDRHTVVDDQLGVLLNDFPYPLQPGSGIFFTINDVVLGVGTTINNATWTASGSASTTSACAGTGITIPTSGNATPYPSTLGVAGAPPSLASVKLELLGLSHTWPDDIDVLLVGPGGESLIAMSDVGGSTGIVAGNLALDDAAALLLPDGGPLVSGSYRPSDVEVGDVFGAPAPPPPYGEPTPVGSDTLTSIFGDTDPNGTWNLYVVDDVGGDSGSIVDWCVAYSPGVFAASSDSASVTVLDPMPFLDGFETGDTSRWSSTVP